MKQKNIRKAISVDKFRKTALLVIQEKAAEGKLSTAVNYRRTFDSFFTYIDQGNAGFILDKDTIEKYELWLRQRGVLRNSSSFYMRNLRALCRMLARCKLKVPSDLFTNVYTGVDKTRKRALSEQTIVRIKNADLLECPKLEFWRDLFLFSFYCRGMSFVDMAYLREENLTDRHIRYARRKTGQWLEVRLEPCMRTIIRRYPGKNGYLFPIISASEEEMAYQQYRSGICVFNRKLKELSAAIGIAPISSYTSRHTWATIARSRQIPLSIISESMGHSSEKITRIYLASFNQQTIDDANRRVIDILM